MKRHALFVGVDQYADGHIPNLSCAVSDATDLHGFFKYGAGYDRVELLQNPAGKKDVLAKVRELTVDLGGGDFFLLFFAGHGFRVGENHVLVCANDLYEDVKYEDDGLPLGQLKRRLSGAFDSALLLDACQSDILATRGGEGIAERDISLIHEAPEDRTCGGALTIVTSCDAGQTAAELSEARHGLFSLAMLDLLKEAQGAHVRIDLSDTFRRMLGQRMDEIAVRSGLSTAQRPRFSCTGDSCFILLGGSASGPAAPSVSLSGSSLPAHVICPICGRHNDVKDTFKCPVCGKDHLCLSHQSKDTYCCPSCAEKRECVKRAGAAYKVGDLDLAYEFLQRTDMEDPEGMYLRAQLYRTGCRGLECNPESAFAWFRKAADLGHVNAYVELGNCYSQGLGVARSEEEAFKCYKYAAEHGDACAQYRVGYCYMHKRGVPLSREDAVKWYRMSAQQGYALAQFLLGGCYDGGYGVERSFQEAVKWWRLSAEGGFVGAQSKLGYCYNYSQKFDESAKWFRMAAEQGDKDAQYMLGDYYECGMGVTRSVEEAEKWFRKAAEQGDEHAQERLSKLEFGQGHLSEDAEELYKKGNCFFSGEGVAQDYEEAVKCYQKAADLGHAEAQYNLGVCFSFGRGVVQNDVEAVKWYQRAAKQGMAAAQDSLGVCYKNGRGVKRDGLAAAKWLRNAAERGWARAQCNYGICFYFGEGVPQSYEDAVKWFAASAKQGYSAAQFMLAVCYESGDGVAQSYVEAVKWYRKAADQGYDDAQLNLGQLFATGHGVDRSYEEAVKWYRLAAEQESARAQYWLGHAYENGEGVPQSYDDAVKWYRKAAELGDEYARERLSEIEKQKQKSKTILIE